ASPWNAGQAQEARERERSRAEHARKRGCTVVVLCYRQPRSSGGSAKVGCCRCSPQSNAMPPARPPCPAKTVLSDSSVPASMESGQLELMPTLSLVVMPPASLACPLIPEDVWKSTSSTPRTAGTQRRGPPDQITVTGWPRWHA